MDFQVCITQNFISTSPKNLTCDTLLSVPNLSLACGMPILVANLSLPCDTSLLVANLYHIRALTIITTSESLMGCKETHYVH